MDVFGDAGSIDQSKFLDYIATRLAGDVATLVKARDELAARQGAMNAVQDALADRAAAATELDKAKKTAATILADAAVQKEAAQIKEQELVSRETVLSANEQAFGVMVRDKELALTEQQATMDERGRYMAEQAIAMAARQSELDAAEAALAARVKAFQEKVAALSV